VTFDDGFADNYDAAHSLLRRGVCSTLHVTTGGSSNGRSVPASKRWQGPIRKMTISETDLVVLDGFRTEAFDIIFLRYEEEKIADFDLGNFSFKGPIDLGNFGG